MKLIDSPPFYGYTIFCDDIRNEVGGKITYVGAYAGQLIVHSDFPITLPKFAFGIVYRQNGDVFVAPKWIRVQLPGDADDEPSIAMELTDQDAMKKAAEQNNPETPIKALHFQFVISPIQLKQEGLIKVRVDRNEEWVRLGALRVRQRKPSSESE